MLAAFRELERSCDFVVCEGTDFVGAAPALDFDLNANLANQLGCPVLVVINGAASADVVEEVQLARELLQRKGCVLFGVIVNRVAPDAVGEVEARLAPNTGEEWVYVMPENAELDLPERGRGPGRARRALGARGRRRCSSATCATVRVAAMSVEHFIEDLEDGDARGRAGRSFGHRRRLPGLHPLADLPGGLGAAADRRLRALCDGAATARDLSVPGA